VLVTIATAAEENGDQLVDVRDWDEWDGDFGSSEERRRGGRARFCNHVRAYGGWFCDAEIDRWQWENNYRFIKVKDCNKFCRLVSRRAGVCKNVEATEKSSFCTGEGQACVCNN